MACAGGIRGTYKLWRQVVAGAHSVEEVPEASVLALAASMGAPEEMPAAAAAAAAVAPMVAAAAAAGAVAAPVHRLVGVGGAGAHDNVMLGAWGFIITTESQLMAPTHSTLIQP